MLIPPPRRAMIGSAGVVAPLTIFSIDRPESMDKSSNDHGFGKKKKKMKEKSEQNGGKNKDLSSDQAIDLISLLVNQGGEIIGEKR